MCRMTGCVPSSWRVPIGAIVTISWAVAAYAAQGTGSLFVAGATHTPTHWNILVGSATTLDLTR